MKLAILMIIMSMIGCIITVFEYRKDINDGDL